MTTPFHPLFYETSKSVALYMDPNKRLQLYLRCPSFASAHKNEVIRIRDLKVRPENFEIDGTIYRLGVITQYTDPPNPRSVVLDNANGGIQEDVDIYGLPPRRTRDEVENVEADNAEMTRLRETIARMEQDRAKPGHRNNIERLNLEAEAYKMRINNTPPPYRHYLQLTISTGKLVKMERVVYDKQFGIAKEYIETMVFGNKKVQVQDLRIGGDKYLNDLDDNFGVQHDPPLHEPLSSPHHKQIIVSGILTNALASLRPILSQIPLRTLTAVFNRHTFPEDPIVNTARFLYIDRPTPISVLSNRPNYRIHLCLAFCQNDYDLNNLVDEWKKRKIRIGTFYSLGTTESSVDHIFGKFRNVPGAKLGENKVTRSTELSECIIIPMGKKTELNVYCSKPNEQEKKLCHWTVKFIVKIIWHLRGYARADEE
ncbi:hypothetical protein CRE_12062 [Caenorhabditis remanei]|uniref:F-box C protein n=1 Tax=Caenorhabditis remanei TaxID=31234 RepID=E3MPQ1_CAERE|nr:hypothetical protein CRE_12062 [Caenorhabditis remanei]